MTLVFVYGSLKRGLSNAGWLKGQEFVGEADTRPGYRMYDWGGFPGMVEVSEGGLAIQGEVWRVDDRCMAGLDRLEDVDRGLYRRARVQLANAFANTEVVSYLYMKSVEGLRDAGSNWTEARPEGGGQHS